MVARGKQDEEGYHKERNRNYKAVKLQQSVLLQPVDQYLIKIALLFIQTRDFVLFSFNHFQVKFLKQYLTVPEYHYTLWHCQHIQCDIDICKCLADWYNLLLTITHDAIANISNLTLTSVSAW